MSGTILVVIADTHIGSSTAVSPLKFVVHNRSSYEAQVMEANRLQRWLYECWVDFWDHAFHLAKKRRLIVVHCGDVVEGVHHGSTQVMNEVADQCEAAMDLLRPITERADAFFGILGTGPSHAGMDNITESEIYKALGAHTSCRRFGLKVYQYKSYHPSQLAVKNFVWMESIIWNG